MIYSDDRDIENLAKRLKIKVVRICDLPLPPSPEVKAIESGPVGSQMLLIGETETRVQEDTDGTKAPVAKTGKTEAGD